MCLIVRYVDSCCYHGSCSLCIWGGNFPVSVRTATGRSFQDILTKISHKVHFNNISKYFFCFLEKKILKKKKINFSTFWALKWTIRVIIGHNFGFNRYINMILVPILMFSGARNLMGIFLNLSDPI